MRSATFLFALVISALAGAAHAQTVTLNKGGFVLTYDCSIHSATRYEYTLPATSWPLPSGCDLS
ncbi:MULTISPECIES: hypothetical protein [unclassified Stenotrophomonas]|uniref:hypothetical protein n=1 Tax=unclassified Stenotrophomonas TaxID=196198 RepID=UPI001F3A4079|nr:MULTISPECIES: hypothetical protein [unclassified Stenotrophomonas]